MYALGLLDTGYRFGGKNPEAGLDCSGMVSYIVEQVSGKKLPYNAAGIAERTRPITSGAMRPGDLVFFNIGRSTRHVGVMVEKNKFLHASSSKGVMISDLNQPYWQRYYWQARRLSQ